MNNFEKSYFLDLKFTSSDNFPESVKFSNMENRKFYYDNNFVGQEKV